MRLLLVEDDALQSHHLRLALIQAGFAVDIVADGVEAEFMGGSEPYDVIVLDLGLPGRSGLDVLRHWRAADNATPVLILTARDAWHEKVDGFKAGADDYLGKPFHAAELIARLHALLRRSNAQPHGPLRVAGIELNEETQQALIPATGARLDLTGTEFRLLRYFMLHPGRVLSKTRLVEHVYDFETERDSNVLEVYINRLRRKLGRDSIATRRGQGYIFSNAELS
ncbi:MAG: response regulator transcription factor [Candidatus Competibacteraceae bacterium]|nr:response regulator transcription factor [Candidatus Competibacteraceae bacterium]